MTTVKQLVERGFDAVALKPSEIAIGHACRFEVGIMTIDYEGREYLPAFELLKDLADEKEVKLTIPIRADGFDPLGDGSLTKRLPPNVGQVLVAGNPAYLTPEERRRAVAPRLRAARDHTPNAWVGTESVERVALAAGGTQFELLSSTTGREVRALRAAGFTGDVAVYAPVVLTDDEDTILDALGEYVARRQPVTRALAAADGATSTDTTEALERTALDSTAVGDAREVLLDACQKFAIVGSPESVEERIAELRDARVETIVGYVADGIDTSYQ